MKLRRISAVAGMVAALGLICSGPALAGTSVSVRVEGLKRSLLPATTVTAPTSGTIRKGGGSCRAASAAGALNIATKGKWNGTFSTGLGIEVTQILGETRVYSKGAWWELFAGNRSASVGVCDLKLHRGEALLFAAVPAKGTTYPLIVTAPKTATKGTPFTVKAFYDTGAGTKTKPVTGVTFAGLSGRTNKKGIATLTASKTGKVSIVGSAKGYIRSAADTVKVSA
jgi:hypothetical protein